MRGIEIIEKQEIIDLYLDGNSAESISKIYKQYSPYQIRKFLKGEGVLKSSHIITDEILLKMLIDYKKGFNFTQLSEKYGFHPVCIGKRIRKHGVNQNKYYSQITKNQVLEAIENMGLELLIDFPEKSINSQTFHVCDKKGYKYITTWTLLKQKHEPLKYSPNNPYSIENINILLNEIRDGEYYCPLNQEYKGNTEDLVFIHKPCNTSFISNLAAMQGKYIRGHYKYYKSCRFCYPEKIESTHASVLKQIFLHEYPDTETEEKSCVNPNTGRILPTDIVNHDLKIAIEIQSEYHDNPDKQKLDKIKKDFWINKKYRFYTPDIRDYSVIEMIQLFFPNINKIPSYIDYHYSDKVDYHKIQIELDTGKTVKEVTSLLNLSPHCIHNAVARGILNLSDESKRKAGQNKGLVHLSKDGKFIKEYRYLNDVSKDDYALGTIQRVLKGTQKFAYDSYWVYSEDYYKNNYKIPKENPDKYLTPIISIKDNEIKYYPDVYKASEQIECYPYEIYNVLKGNRKSFRGYKFKYN